jgi:hypothetical protein
VPSESKIELVRKKADERARAKTDKMYLANEVLGYDFQECHRELFALYPDFSDTSWAEQIVGFEDILVLWPRGHYKSTAVKVVIVQAILNNPDIPILLMQGNIALTELFMEEIAKHFRGEVPDSRLRELFPEFCGSKKELNNTKRSFTVPCRKRTQTPQATCTVASPKSIKTSQHYLLGIFDDLQNESNSTNPVQVEKVYQDFINCQPLVQHGARWVSGTRWAFGDCYEQIIEWARVQEKALGRKWRISVKDCWSDDRKDVRFERFKKRNGEYDGFTRQDLLQLLAQRPAWFACQYLNKPVLESQQIITKEMLDGARIVPDHAPALGRPVFFLDLAATDSDTYSDDCVILVGQVDGKGKMYASDQRGGLWNALTFALNIIQSALAHRPMKILIEKSAAGMIFVDFLRIVAREKGIYLPLDFIKVDTKADAKNRRVEALAGHIKQGRFKFFFGLAQWEKACEQAIQFPKGRHGHDDYPDTWALMAQHFSQSMLFLPNPQIPTTRHPVVAILDRDPVSQIDSTGQESECRDGMGTMGGDFAC